MDLHRAFLNRHQKATMDSYIPHPCGSDFFNPILYFGNQGAALHSLNKGNGYNLPHKSFSYPNCFNNFKVSPEKFVKKAMNFTQGIYNHDNSVPAMSLTCIVGGFVDRKQAELSHTKYKSQNSTNPMENIVKDLVSKSIEISRTMSCPDPFNRCDLSSIKVSSGGSTNAEFIRPVNNTSKMTYADVAKKNLCNLKKNVVMFPETPVVNNLSSHKTNNKHGKKECNVISSTYRHKNSLNNPNSNYRQFGTNDCVKTKKNFVKPKFQSHGKPSSSCRPQSRRMHDSLKKELGTKKNNQLIDLDGSMWSKENTDMNMFEDCIVHRPSGPPIILRVRSISSESDCSSEQSDCLKNPRIRSLSECSVDSVDSDDSFIVFDECVDDNVTDDSCDEETSDECLSVVDYYSESPQEKWLQCVDAKSVPDLTFNESSSHLKGTNCSNSPCAVLKKVRFACGEALAKVRKLCVWDYAHRAARVGPWEQAARDRARFSARICTLAPIINPVLDPAHRARIYDCRFAFS